MRQAYKALVLGIHIKLTTDKENAKKSNKFLSRKLDAGRFNIYQRGSKFVSFMTQKILPFREFKKVYNDVI